MKPIQLEAAHKALNLGKFVEVLTENYNKYPSYNLITKISETEYKVMYHEDMSQHKSLDEINDLINEPSSIVFIEV